MDYQAAQEKERTYAGKTSAERQALWRKRQKQRGLVRAFGYVHQHQMPGLLQLIEMLQRCPDLEVAGPRNTLSGRLHKLR